MRRTLFQSGHESERRGTLANFSVGMGTHIWKDEILSACVSHGFAICGCTVEDLCRTFLRTESRGRKKWHSKATFQFSRPHIQENPNPSAVT